MSPKVGKLEDGKETMAAGNSNSNSTDTSCVADTKKLERPALVHNYTDYSQLNDAEKETFIKPSSAANPFPLMLHKLLDAAEENNFTHVVAWKAHGRAFCIFEKTKFTKDVMPLYFRQTQFASFQRQLNLYGFRRLTRHGPDQGAYYNAFFLRGMPELCANLIRRKVNGNEVRLSSSPTTEPDFYSMPPVGVRKASNDNNSNGSNSKGSKKKKARAKKDITGSPLTMSSSSSTEAVPTTNSNDELKPVAVQDLSSRNVKVQEESITQQQQRQRQQESKQQSPLQQQEQIIQRPQHQSHLHQQLHSTPNTGPSPSTTQPPAVAMQQFLQSTKQQQQTSETSSSTTRLPYAALWNLEFLHQNPTEAARSLSPLPFERRFPSLSSHMPIALAPSASIDTEVVPAPRPLEEYDNHCGDSTKQQQHESSNKRRRVPIALLEISSMEEHSVEDMARFLRDVDLHLSDESRKSDESTKQSSQASTKQSSQASATQV